MIYNYYSSRAIQNCAARQPTSFHRVRPCKPLNWGESAGATSSSAPNMRPIRVMCSGRVDPQFVLKAFQQGADGVMIAGCHPGECHYVEGDIKAMRRFYLLRRLLKQWGIEEERLQLVWASASEGTILAAEVDRMTDQVRALGPLDWRGTVLGGNGHVASLEKEKVAEEA